MTKDDYFRNMKKSKSITIPAKKVTKQVAPKTKPKTKAQKVTAKVQAKAHRTTTKAPQEAPQPQQELQLSDFRLQTTVDNIGIHVTTTYLGNAIHRFTLPVAEFGKWQSMAVQRKQAYVQVRTFVNAFGNDLRIIQTVIQSTIQVLNNLFAKAQAQQQQAQRLVQ